MGYEAINMRPLQRRSAFIQNAKVVAPDQNGRMVDQDMFEAGAFMPGTYQGRRIPWSAKKREFLIEMTDEKLNELVKKMDLIDPETGNKIIHANRKNPKDPFFNLVDLALIMEAGNLNFDAYDEKTEILKAGMKARREVVSHQEFVDSEGAMTASQQFIMTSDKEMAETRAENNDLEMDAAAALKTLTQNFKKMKYVAYILGVNDNPDIEPTNLKNMMYHDIVKEGKRSVPEMFEKKKMIDVFLDIDAMDNAEVQLLHSIVTAHRKHIIRTNRDGASFNGNIITKTRSYPAILRALLEPGMEDVVMDIEERIVNA
jgi:hypothetical protein